MRFTIEALKSGLRHVNGPRAVAMGLQHNPSFPPRGKLFDARLVRNRVLHRYELIAQEDVFGPPQPTGLLFEGEELHQQGSPKDRRPFKLLRNILTGKFSVHVDPMDFVSTELLDAYLLRLKDDHGATVGAQINKAHEGEVVTIVVTATKMVGAYFCSKQFLTKALDKLGEEISSDLVRMYQLLKDAVGSSRDWVRNRGKGKMLCLTLSEAPTVELIVHSSDPDDLLHPVLDLGLLQAAALKALALSSIADVEKIQLLWKGGEWKLSHMVTKSGDVLGALATFRQRDVVLLDMMRSGRRVGGSIGGFTDFRSIQSTPGIDVPDGQSNKT